MKNILVFICLMMLLINPFIGYSEDNNLFQRSIRVGGEVSYPIRSVFMPEIVQYEGSFDIEFSKNWFAKVEAGILNVNIDRQDYDYYSDGWFYRIGFDYNLLEREDFRNNDILYFGIRYGYSNQAHGANNIIVWDGYWNKEDPYTTSIEKNYFATHWSELVGGLKTELYRNLFIGWSLRLRFVVFETDDSLLKPYVVGGYGKGDDRVTVDFNYSIFYRIPF